MVGLGVLLCWRRQVVYNTSVTCVCAAVFFNSLPVWQKEGGGANERKRASLLSPKRARIVVYAIGDWYIVREGGKKRNVKIPFKPRSTFILFSLVVCYIERERPADYMSTMALRNAPTLARLYTHTHTHTCSLNIQLLLKSIAFFTRAPYSQLHNIRSI